MVTISAEKENVQKNPLKNRIDYEKNLIKECA